MLVNEKICSRCKQTKPLTSFGKNKRVKSGYGAWCKSCHNEYMREHRKTPEYRAKEREWTRSYRERHPDFIYNYNKQWVEKNKERAYKQRYEWNRNNRDKVNKSNYNWYDRHPDVKRAHHYNNKLSLKKKCERCSSIDNLQRHHPDYSKPKEIVTLCKPCHLQTQSSL